MTSVEHQPLREFVGFVWPADDFGDQTGVLVLVQNVTEAATQVREAYGKRSDYLHAMSPNFFVDPELVAAARSVLSSGGSLDEAASAVLERTTAPMDAAKVLLQIQPGLSFDEVKLIVVRNLNRPQQDEVEQVWAAADSLESDPTPPA